MQRGQVQEGPRCFQRLAAQHASDRFVKIRCLAVGYSTKAYFRYFGGAVLIASAALTSEF